MKHHVFFFLSPSSLGLEFRIEKACPLFFLRPGDSPASFSSTHTASFQSRSFSDSPVPLVLIRSAPRFKGSGASLFPPALNVHDTVLSWVPVQGSLQFMVTVARSLYPLSSLRAFSCPALPCKISPFLLLRRTV